MLTLFIFFAYLRVRTEPDKRFKVEPCSYGRKDSLHEKACDRLLCLGSPCKARDLPRCHNSHAEEAHVKRRKFRQSILAIPQ